MSPPRISQHVVQRYVERVDPGASRTAARLRVEQILALGRWRTSPRHWMKQTQPHPGKLFVYWAGLPGVCVIVVNRTAVTLVTREMAMSARRDSRLVAVGVAAKPDRPALKPAPAWRWDGDTQESA